MRARHAFGKSSSIETAKQANKIDAFDILFLDGDTEPKVGWLDAQGTTRIAEGKKQIVRVDELPTADGDENVVYIYENEGYVWDGTQCISLSKSVDLTALETQISDIETEVANKVDATTVEEMITTAIEKENAIEVVEF